MASNVSITPGTGATIRTDDVSGVEYQVVKLDVGGAGVSVPVVGALPVTGTFYQTTQPVSASALPLPTGAATSANQSTEITALNQIHADLIAALPAGANTIGGVQLVDSAGTNKATVSAGGAVKVDASATTQPVSAALLPLPTGAATAANQSAEITALNQIHADLIAALPAGSNVIGGVTQSGTWTARLQDGGGTALTSTLYGSKQRLDVNLAAGGTPGSTAPTTADLVAGTDGTNLRAFSVDTSGRLNTNINGTVPVSGTFWQTTQPVSLASLPALATGSATIGGVQLVDSAGTNKATINSSGAQLVNFASGTTITGPASQTATTATNILASDSVTNTTASPYASGILEMTSTGTAGAWIVEQSVAGTTWNPVVLYEATVIAGAPINAAVTATASTRLFKFAITAPLLRVRISTTITGGSLQASAFLSQLPFAAPVLSAVQATAANFNATVSGTVTANIGTGSLAVGTNAIGDVGVQYRANATGAASFVSVQSPATPAATVCKAGAGRLIGWSLQNSSAAIRSVKFWNTAQGSVTLGTTAAVFEIDIAAGGRTDLHFEGGIGFATAITYAVTGAKGLSDNTGSLTANDVSGVLVYA